MVLGENTLNNVPEIYILKNTIFSNIIRIGLNMRF